MSRYAPTTRANATVREGWVDQVGVGDDERVAAIVRREAERGPATRWTVPRVEVPTRLGLVVVALRRGRAVVVSGHARLAPILVPAREANLLEPERPEMRLTPKDGADYLLAVAEANPGAMYRSHPGDVLEGRRFFRRWGRASAVLLPVTGTIAVHGDLTDARRRWVSEQAVLRCAGSGARSSKGRSAGHSAEVVGTERCRYDPARGRHQGRLPSPRGEGASQDRRAARGGGLACPGCQAGGGRSQSRRGDQRVRAVERAWPRRLPAVRQWPVLDNLLAGVPVCRALTVGSRAGYA